MNETHVFIMKFKVPWSLLPESVVQFLTPPKRFFTKMIIRNVSWQNMTDFLSVVIEKFPVNVQLYLLVYGINDD